jgi:type II secretory pathway pseudopilin PulG
MISKDKGGMLMNRKQGFTLAEIVILVMISVLIAAIAIPSFVKARNRPQQDACINNLRLIDSCKEDVAVSYRLTAGDMVVTASVNQYIKGATTPICPSGGTYTYGNIGSNPECSITTPTSHIFGGGRR